MTEDEVRQRAAIDRVLRVLRRQPWAGHVIVFGSVAAGAVVPGDVDILIMGDDHRGALAIARRHYPLLDVFVEIEGRLHVRNPEATGWDKAIHPRAMRDSMRRTGVALADIPDMETQA